MINMAQEIERKFLVKGEFKDSSTERLRIVQGYLSSVPERTVRVRIMGGKGFITVKGAGSQSGASRFEWEKEIPVSEAEELLKICEPGIIDKIRFIVPFEGHVFEVDEFYGDNEGLVMAEVELDDENEVFAKPGWLGEEVTGNSRYYNSNLMKSPFKNWR